MRMISYKKFYKKEVLEDCWNGDISIEDIVISKINHIGYYLRNHGHEEDLYTTYDVFSSLSENLKKEIVDFNLQKEIAFYPTINKDFSIISFGNATQDWVSQKFGVNSDLYLIVLKDGKSKAFYLAYKKKDGKSKYDDLFLKYKKKYPKSVLNDFSVVKRIEFTSIDDLKCRGLFPQEYSYDDFLKKPTIYVPTTLYGKLPKEVLNKLRGRRMAFHTLWNFRKMLKKYSEYTEDFIYQKNENLEEYEKKRKEMFMQLSEYYYDNSSRWWD